MLDNTSTLLTGTETFDEAFKLIPENKPKVRYLRTEDNEPTSVYQVYNQDKQNWGSPRTLKYDKDHNPIMVTDSKQKLRNAGAFYDVFTKPTHAGGFNDKSWLIGDIDHCEIQGEDYNVQGLIVSSIFDPKPKYYISFERLVCENQMSSLGTSNSSMYIDMNEFLKQSVTADAKEKLRGIIMAEIEKRLAMQEAVYSKLKGIHLTDERIEEMFKKLTVDTVAKESQKYEEQVQKYEYYMKAYNRDDNQNYKNTFMGFVNTCTNVNTRTKTNPLDIVKPVVSPDILIKPCNLEYLYRDVLVNAA